MKLIKQVFFFACMVSLVGCLDNTGSEPTIVTEPSAISQYYIANQSDVDLNATYKMAFADIDSTVAVPTDSTTKIFELLRTTFPTPSEALAKLRFYNLSGDNTTPRLTIEPIVDKSWHDVTAENDTTKKYQLVITDKDLK